MTAEMRLSGECPKCKSHLVRRKRRSDGVAFLSCSGYSECRFAEDWDPQVAALASDLESLRAKVARMRAEMRRASHSAPDVSKQLREVIAYAHPDKWPNALDLAHGVTRQLNALRDRLRGAH